MKMVSIISDQIYLWNFDDKKDNKCWDDHHVVTINDTELWLHNWRFEEFNIHHIHSWQKLYEVKTHNKYYNCGPSAELFKYYIIKTFI